MSRKTLVIYLVCEPETPELARAAVESGADAIELGFPFSDPLADGPVIQRASERALARGMRTAQCLECLAATRGLVGDAPILPMTYAALLEAYGWERFATDAAAAGATSMIVSDVPAGQRPELAARPPRRPHLDGRADSPRRVDDRRLALPRHADGHDGRPRRAVRRARGPRRANAPARGRRAALRRLRHLDARARGRGRGAGRRHRRRVPRGAGRGGRPGGARRRTSRRCGTRSTLRSG